MYKRDIGLDEAIMSIRNPVGRIGTDTDAGLVTIWTKEEALDFLQMSDTTYAKLSKAQKERAFDVKGIILHKIEGRGENTTFIVTATDKYMYNVWLRGNYKSSPVVDAYLDDLHDLNGGRLKLNGARICPTLEELATKYASMYGGTMIAAKRKINRIRATLRSYEYIVKAKESSVKDIRVKERGCSHYLTGSRAITMSYDLSVEFAKFYQELDRRFPMNNTDSRHMREQKQNVRQHEKDDFLLHLKRKYNIDYMRPQRISTLSTQGTTDFQAIQLLYLKGATLTEIENFLAGRPQYWAEQTDSYNIETIL